jgi:hypothetical protein
VRWGGRAGVHRPGGTKGGSGREISQHYSPNFPPLPPYPPPTYPYEPTYMPWDRPLPNCVRELDHAMSDPRVKAAFERARTACGANSKPTIKFVKCDNPNDFGAFICNNNNSDVIEICLIGQEFCPNPSSIISTLLHELEHQIQACTLHRDGGGTGPRCEKWDNRSCNYTVRAEIEAYCTDPILVRYCDAAQRGDCAAAGHVCNFVCKSIPLICHVNPAWFFMVGAMQDV